MLAIGAGGGCLYIFLFSFISLFFFLSPGDSLIKTEIRSKMGS